jgi:hypothetical protein
MADIVKTEGLVLAITDGSGNTYPFACASSSNISITRDLIELAPKTNTNYREYINGRQTATISGSGLVKISQSNMHPITFFDGFIEATDTTYVGYLDLIDPQNNYKLYKFSCILQNLSLDSNYSSTPTYNYTLQVTGAFTELTVVDTYIVASGKITARDTATHKLVAVGYGGKWYYNYSVTDEGGGVFSITLGTSLNGTSVVAAYIAI